MPLSADNAEKVRFTMRYPGAAAVLPGASPSDRFTQTALTDSELILWIFIWNFQATFLWYVICEICKKK